MVTRYASSAQDPTILPSVPLNPQNTQGKQNTLQSNIQIPNAAVATSMDVFGRVPSGCKIEPGSKLFYQAVTGVTSYDVGLFVEASPMVPDTTKGTDNCLISAQDIHLAGSVDCSAAISPDKGAKYAWEQAGLAADPGGWLLVVGTIDVGPASVAAWVDAHIHYRTI